MYKLECRVEAGQGAGCQFTIQFDSVQYESKSRKWMMQKQWWFRQRRLRRLERVCRVTTPPELGFQ